jgi:probable F420-dependent oxidoreductase
VFHDPLTVLTWAAAATGRAGLGTSVLVAPYRHPVALARSLASLDALSGGRVVCGIASGWMEFEFRALGVPFRERGARTDETIQVMRRLWAGAGDFTWRGERVEGVALRPGPARPGGPPVWVGGNSDAGIRRAVRLGDGWHTTVAHEEGLRERVDALDRALAAAGRDRDRDGFTLSVRVRADAARIARIAPRLRDLGADHLLVDLPAFSPDRFRDEVARLRDLI